MLDLAEFETDFDSSMNLNRLFYIIQTNQKLIQIVFSVFPFIKEKCTNMLVMSSVVGYCAIETNDS